MSVRVSGRARAHRRARLKRSHKTGAGAAAACAPPVSPASTSGRASYAVMGRVLRNCFGTGCFLVAMLALCACACACADTGAASRSTILSMSRSAVGLSTRTRAMAKGMLRAVTAGDTRAGADVSTSKSGCAAPPHGAAVFA